MTREFGCASGVCSTATAWKHNKPGNAREDNVPGHAQEPHSPPARQAPPSVLESLPRWQPSSPHNTRNQLKSNCPQHLPCPTPGTRSFSRHFTRSKQTEGLEPCRVCPTRLESRHGAATSATLPTASLPHATLEGWGWGRAGETPGRLCEIVHITTSHLCGPAARFTSLREVDTKHL